MRPTLKIIEPDESEDFRVEVDGELVGVERYDVDRSGNVFLLALSDGRRFQYRPSGSWEPEPDPDDWDEINYDGWARALVEDVVWSIQGALDEEDIADLIASPDDRLIWDAWLDELFWDVTSIRQRGQLVDALRAVLLDITGVGQKRALANKVLAALLAGQPVREHTWSEVVWHPSVEAPGMLSARVYPPGFSSHEIAWLDDSGLLSVVDDEGNVVTTGVVLNNPHVHPKEH